MTLIDSLIVPGSKVLLAPLNWGLGHATRCIPIISELLKLKCQITIASDGAPLELLQEEFPELASFELPSYDIHYKHDSLFSNILVQLPKMSKVLRKENLAIQKKHEVNQWDYIISDCRYGIHAKGAKNILISHQLNLQFDSQWLKQSANFVNQRFLNNYDQIWVPDFENHLLSGALSKTDHLDQHEIHFLGALSRLKIEQVPTQYDLAVLLSGPEPKRSIFENKLWAILSETEYSIAWIRGIKAKWNQSKDDIDVFGRVASTQLNKLLNSSSIVISRTGYTTIMDLYHLKKKAILVPTPGQNEQEYLGTLLKNNAMFEMLVEDDLAQLIPILNQLQSN